MVRDDGLNAIARNGHEDQRETEQSHDREFPFDMHIGGHDDWNGKDDQHHIGDNIGGPHGQQLDDTLSTLRTWIWRDLPVMIVRKAFDVGGDDDADKGDEEEPSNDLQADLI